MGNKRSGPAVLTEFDIQRIMRNTGFTRFEVIYWHSNFMKRCPNGKLTSWNFAQTCKTLFPNGEFNFFDADGNGIIDFDEFMNALKVTRQKDVMEKLVNAINDADGEEDSKERELVDHDQVKHKNGSSNVDESI